MCSSGAISQFLLFHFACIGHEIELKNVEMSFLPCFKKQSLLNCRYRRNKAISMRQRPLFIYSMSLVGLYSRSALMSYVVFAYSNFLQAKFSLVQSMVKKRYLESPSNGESIGPSLPIENLELFMSFQTNLIVQCPFKALKVDHFQRTTSYLAENNRFLNLINQSIELHIKEPWLPEPDPPWSSRPWSQSDRMQQRNWRTQQDT